MSGSFRKLIPGGIAAAAWLLWSCGGISPPEKVSRHLEYKGYSKPGYESFSKKSHYVKMKDGVSIAVDTFVPGKAAASKSGASKGDSGSGKSPSPKSARRFPTILVITPYNRSLIFERMSLFQKLGAYWKYGTMGPVFDGSARADVRRFLAHGYAVVFSGMRGTGASGGTQAPFDPALANDAEELIAWIRSRGWSDGKLCMMGRSYRGWIQLMVAARKPEGLKCIMPEVIVFDGYTEGVRPGGIDALAWITEYSRLLTGLNRSDYNPDRLLVPATPVIDEDGDGRLLDEIPTRSRGNPRSFLDQADSPPRYKDGKPRENIYYNAIAQHKRNLPFTTLLRKNMPFMDSPPPAGSGIADMTFAQSSPGYYIREIVESGIAVYHVGGWFDGFVEGTSKLYATMRAAGARNMKLHIAPRFHYQPYITEAYKKHLSYAGNYMEQLATEQLRFFDYHLKGIPNGIAGEPSVNIYVMNSGWRSEREWPLKRARSRTLYLASGNALSAKAADKADRDLFDVDFTHQSSFGTNKINRWLMMYLPDTIMDRTAADRKTITYETPPLNKDTEVTGHPLMKLFVSSNRSDGDVHVFISEVTPDGRSINVSEGRLRAGWHRLRDDDSQVDNRVDVLPNLPYHGFRREQYAAAPFKDGKVVKLEFALMPAAYKFRKGHRIRIAVAGADLGNFEMNPFLCKGNRPVDCPRTRYGIHRGGRYASRIELPIIPD